VREIGKGEGLGYAVNVPMLPGADDKVFLEGFFAVVPRLLRHFDPDVIVSQLGLDTFWNDPLAALEFTTNGYCRVISFLTEHAPAWVALGGGGYDIQNVARAWTLTWAMMNGVDLPDDLPSTVMNVPAGVKRKLRDSEHHSKGRGRCMQHMAEVVEYLEREVFPIHGSK